MFNLAVMGMIPLLPTPKGLRSNLASGYIPIGDITYMAVMGMIHLLQTLQEYVLPCSRSHGYDSLAALPDGDITYPAVMGMMLLLPTPMGI